jgi:hypothetical protein
MTKEIRSPMKLVVRCFAERIDGQWQAFSIDFGLAAQGDSFPDVKRKLDAMIESYLHDALVGEDREHAEELLSRKAPWQITARYMLYSLISKTASTFLADSGRHKVYGEPMALEPKHCAA